MAMSTINMTSTKLSIRFNGSVKYDVYNKNGINRRNFKFHRIANRKLVHKRVQGVFPVILLVKDLDYLGNVNISVIS